MGRMLARALARHLGILLYAAAISPGVHPRVSSCRHCLTLPADYRGYCLALPDEGLEHDFPDNHGRLWRWCSRCGRVCVRPDALCYWGEQPDPASFRDSRLCFTDQMVKFVLWETAAGGTQGAELLLADSSPPTWKRREQPDRP